MARARSSLIFAKSGEGLTHATVAGYFLCSDMRSCGLRPGPSWSVLGQIWGGPNPRYSCWLLSVQWRAFLWVTARAELVCSWL